MSEVEKITTEGAVDRYADMVYRLAFSQMKNKTDADDLFQEVFIRLVRHIDEMNSWEHVKAWLIKVTVNCARKHFDLYWNKNVTSLYDDEAVDEVFEEAYDEIPEEHPVRAAVSRLPEKYRLIVHLFYFEELSIKEISEITNQKETTVKTQMFRAREMLKQIMKGETDL